MYFNFFIFLFVSSSIFSMEYTFRKTPENATHFYVDNPDLILWDNTPIVYDKYGSYLETIDLLSKAQNYEVNYLFVQFFYITEEENTQKLNFFNLFIDEKNNNLNFLPTKDLKITNFYSRLEKKQRPTISDFYINYKNASDFKDLSLAHSEVLFGNFFLKAQKNLLSILKNDMPRIKNYGLIFYSSLDCCDYCQNFLTEYFFNNLDLELKKNKWTYLFLSTNPCKKSSYNAYLKNKIFSFCYDKEQQTFFSLVEKTPVTYFPVYSSYVIINTLETNPNVIGYIKKQ